MLQLLRCYYLRNVFVRFHYIAAYMLLISKNIDKLHFIFTFDTLNWDAPSHANLLISKRLFIAFVQERILIVKFFMPKLASLSYLKTLFYVFALLTNYSILSLLKQSFPHIFQNG